jgi:hypothetical protein
MLKRSRRITTIDDDRAIAKNRQIRERLRFEL